MCVVRMSVLRSSIMKREFALTEASAETRLAFLCWTALSDSDSQEIPQAQTLLYHLETRNDIASVLAGKHNPTSGMCIHQVP